jgi:hypothetical protein
MRTASRILVLVTAGLACIGLGAQETDMGFVGKTVVIRYESGLEIQAHYESDTRMIWTALSGPQEGQQGTERIHAEEVAPDVYFISWVEDSGVTVSNVLNFHTHGAFAFVTFDAGGARRPAVEKGVFREVGASRTSGPGMR